MNGSGLDGSFGPALFGSALEVTIAIPTFRRPEMLNRLLEEVRGQALEFAERTGGCARIFVADNDPEGSARVVVANHPDVIYEQVLTPGIAAVRSACLVSATGDLIQFIDDDEEPSPDWLETMVGSWLELGRPTALAGSVLTKFDSSPSPWVESGRFFERDRPPTGTVLSAAPAGNLLLNLVEVRRLGITFDSRLGLRGGEDTLFTKQLIAAGGQIRFCREGVVYDLVPDERNTRRWVLRRAWHHGNTTSIVALWQNRGGRRRLIQARLLISGFSRTVVGVSRAAIGSLRASDEKNARGWRLAHRGMGIVSGALRQGPAEYDRSDDDQMQPLSGPDFARRLRLALDEGKDAARRDVGLVIVNYGASDLLETNLPGSLGDDAVAQIIVVDNYSTDQERTKLRTVALARGWSVVEPEGNLGFGQGVNAGVLRAADLGCTTFVTINPDARADGTVLKALAEAARSQPNTLISPLVVDSDGKPRFRGSTVSMRTGRMRGGWMPDDTDPVWKNWLTGACMAFSGTAFARLGGFAGEYFLYWEDVDLSRRAVNMGMDLVFRDDLCVIHDEGGTHTEPGSRSRSSLYYYYNTRNRLLFGARLTPRAHRTNWLLSTPRESMMIWLRGGRKQFFTKPAGTAAAARGALEGLLTYRRHVD